MFKKFLMSLTTQHNDGINDRIDKEPIVSKYWFFMGGAIIFTLMTTIIGLFSIFVYDNKSAPVTYAINLKEKTQQEIVVLPFPHQSFKNVSSWIIDAVTAAYSLDFRKFDQQVNDASYYFTPEGYSTYKTALVTAKVREFVVGKKMQISVIPTQSPVLVNGGTFGSTEFWRFKLPVLVSYYGGRDPIIQRQLVEVLILRVPAHQNYKGLAIAEFNMVNL